MKIALMIMAMFVNLYWTPPKAQGGLQDYVGYISYPGRPWNEVTVWDTTLNHRLRSTFPAPAIEHGLVSLSTQDSIWYLGGARLAIAGRDSSGYIAERSNTCTCQYFPRDTTFALVRDGEVLRWLRGAGLICFCQPFFDGHYYRIEHQELIQLSEKNRLLRNYGYYYIAGIKRFQ